MKRGTPSMEESQKKQIKMENMEVIDTYKAPETWLELPLNIWLRVMTYLEIEDIENIHLASRNFHEIANNHPHKIILGADVDSTALVKCSRVCDYVEVNSFGDIDAIRIFFLIIGAQIRKVTLKNLSWTSSGLQELLRLLPNVQSLHLDFLGVIQDEFSQLPVKFRKLKILTFYNSSREFIRDFLDLLVCSPSRLSFKLFSGSTIENFLDKQKNSVKVLELSKCEDRQPNVSGFKLEDLKLAQPYTRDDSKESKSISISKLTQQNSLKSLYMDSDFATCANLKFVFQNLERLEVLHLTVSEMLDPAYYRQLYQFKHLRSLAIFDSYDDSGKADFILGLTANVNENLTELATTYACFSQDQLSSLSRCLPNLKEFYFDGSNLQDLRFLSCFQNLKQLKLDNIFAGSLPLVDIEPITKINVLHIVDWQDYAGVDHIKNLAHLFPVLEKFSNKLVYAADDDLIITILECFPQLKILRIQFEEDYDAKKYEEKYQSFQLVRYLKEQRKNLEWIDISSDSRFNVDFLKNGLKDVKGLRFSSDSSELVDVFH